MTTAPSRTGAMGAKLTAFDRVPLIDIGPLLGPDRAAFEACARAIGAACREVGFFYVANHGVPEELIERAYARSRAFHALPTAEKDRVHVRRSFGNRGWLPTSDEDPDPDTELHRLVEPKDPKNDYLTKPQLHAAFDLALDLPEDDPDHRAGNVMLGPNQWPDLPGFKEDVTAYYDAVMALGRTLFRAFAAALGLPDDFFNDQINKPTSQLRLLHYPANDRPMDNTHLGIGAHSDFECFTILNTRGPGLQVMNAADEWIEAPPVPNTFIVNVGDLLEAWTNGLFKATQHRVVNTGAERYSLPLFFAADYDTVVEPLPGFVGPDNPPRYTRVVAGHHLAGFTINGTRHLRRRVREGTLRIDFPIHPENPFKREAVNEHVDEA